MIQTLQKEIESLKSSPVPASVRPSISTSSTSVHGVSSNPPSSSTAVSHTSRQSARNDRKDGGHGSHSRRSGGGDRGDSERDRDRERDKNRHRSRSRSRERRRERDRDRDKATDKDKGRDRDRDRSSQADKERAVKERDKSGIDEKRSDISQSQSGSSGKRHEREPSNLTSMEAAKSSSHAMEGVTPTAPTPTAGGGPTVLPYPAAEPRSGTGHRSGPGLQSTIAPPKPGVGLQIRGAGSAGSSVSASGTASVSGTKPAQTNRINILGAGSKVEDDRAVKRRK